MPRIYDAELETALRDAFRADFEGESEVPTPKKPQPAGALARGLQAQYQAACKGRRILQVLRKPPLSAIDEALMLEDRITRLPDLFADLATINQALKEKRISQQRYNDLYKHLVGILGYPPGIYLGSLTEALAQARCELAEARWRAVDPAGPRRLR